MVKSKLKNKIRQVGYISWVLVGGAIGGFNQQKVRVVVEVVFFLGILELKVQVWTPQFSKIHQIPSEEEFGPLKAFLGGVWGSKHLLTRCLEDQG